MAGVRKKKIDKVSLRNSVLKAATAAFYKHGIKTVRMDDIAADLSISKRTLYELFSDKEELLLEVARMHHDDLAGFMNSIAEKAENVLEVIIEFYLKMTKDLQEINVAFYDDLKKYPKVVEFLTKRRKNNAQKAISFYYKGVEQGIFRDDVNYHIVQDMLHLQNDLMIQIMKTKDYSALEVFETMIFTHFRGVSTEKGLKIVNGFFEELKQQKKLEIK